MKVLAKPLASSTNPYNTQLYNALEKLGVKAFNAGGVRLLWGRFQIFHVHWPDRVFYMKGPRWVHLLLLRIYFLVMKLRGMRIVYTMHNVWPKNAVSERHISEYYSILNSFLDGVIVPKREDLTLAEELFPHAKVVQIPLGVLSPCEDRDTSVYSKLALDPSQFREQLFIPGIQERTKRTEVTLRVLVNAGLADRVVVVGHFPDAQYYLDLCREFECKGITIKNCFLSEAEFMELLSAASCVIASQIGGSNSGIALMCVAIGQVCICATSEIAASVRDEYGTDLIYSLEALDYFDEVLSAARQNDPEKKSDRNSIDEVAAETVEFFRKVYGA